MRERKQRWGREAAAWGDPFPQGPHLPLTHSLPDPHSLLRGRMPPLPLLSLPIKFEFNKTQLEAVFWPHGRGGFKKWEKSGVPRHRAQGTPPKGVMGTRPCRVGGRSPLHVRGDTLGNWPFKEH